MSNTNLQTISSRVTQETAKRIADEIADSLRSAPEEIRASKIHPQCAHVQEHCPETAIIGYMRRKDQL